MGRYLDEVKFRQRYVKSHTVFYKSRLGSRKAGLEYWLDVHDPVLRLASAALPPGHPVYAITVAGIIEMALLNCTHVIAAHTPHTPPPPNTSWRPSQWIPCELARTKKAGSAISRQAAGWFHPQVHPPESRWTVWNVRTAAPSTLRRTHQGCLDRMHIGSVA